MLKNSSEKKTQIKGKFKDEFHLNRKELARFLRNFADSVEKGNKLEIKTDNWVLPFKFRDNVEVEIDSEHDELEIGIEFDRLEDRGNISVS